MPDRRVKFTDWFSDASFRLFQAANFAIKAAFSLSSLTASRTFTLPDTSATLAHIGTAAQTFGGDITINGVLTNTDLGAGVSRLVTVAGSNAGVVITRASAGTSAPSINMQKSQGTTTSPTAVATGAGLFQLQGRGYGGTGYRFGGEIAMTVTETTPSDTAMGTKIDLNVSPNGSVTRSAIVSADWQNGLSVAGGVVIDANRLVQDRVSTLATLQTGAAGKSQWASDLGGGAGMLHYNGTSWRRVTSGYETVGDADNTYTPLTSADIQEETVALTSNRVTTIATTNAVKGDRYTFVRSGLGAFTRTFHNATAGGTLLYTSASLTSETITFVFDGSAWRLMQHSIL